MRRCCTGGRRRFHKTCVALCVNALLVSCTGSIHSDQFGDGNASPAFGQQQGHKRALSDAQCPYTATYVRQWFANVAASVSRPRLRTAFHTQLSNYRKLDAVFLFVVIRGGAVHILPRCGPGKRFRCLCGPGTNDATCAALPSLRGGGIPMTIFEGRTYYFFRVLDEAARLPGGLPDSEFIVNFDDHPRSKDANVPVFSPCADTCKVDIPIPVDLPGFDGGSGDWKWPQPGDDLAALTPWEQRSDRAFWRSTARLPQRNACMWRCGANGSICARDKGVCSSGRRGNCYGSEWRRSPRAAVAALAARHHNILDVSYSGYCCSAMLRERNPPAFPHDLLKLEFGTERKFATWEQMAQHKYLLALDGNSYATGYAGLLLLGSTVLRHDSPFPLFFEGTGADAILRNDRDFVRIRADLADLPAKVAELQHDDARAKRIARSGAKTIARAASSGAAACYMQLVLQEYSMRLTGEVSHEL